MLASGEKRGVYRREEVVANAVLLLLAGHETTINLICNGTLAFIRHPDQWALLQRDPSLAMRATEECLRYDPPVKSLQRIAAQDVELGGKVIRSLDRVRWFLTSANRDPEKFSAPEKFDITRSEFTYCFGSGIHHCLGATLARVEGQEAFKALVQRFPLCIWRRRLSNISRASSSVAQVPPGHMAIEREQARSERLPAQGSVWTRNEVMIREGIQAVVEGRNLTEAEAIAVMREIMEGSASPAQIAAFIVGLRMKGETVEEITGCARVMDKFRQHAIRSNPSRWIPPAPGAMARIPLTFPPRRRLWLLARGGDGQARESGGLEHVRQCRFAGSSGRQHWPGASRGGGVYPRGGHGLLLRPALHGAMRHAIGPRREIGAHRVQYSRPFDQSSAGPTPVGWRLRR